MRKLLAILLASLLIFNTTAGISYAVNENLTKQEIQQEENAIIPLKLEKEIKTSLAKVYGQENVEVIYSNILAIAKKARKKDPPL